MLISREGCDRLAHWMTRGPTRHYSVQTDLIVKQNLTEENMAQVWSGEESRMMGNIVALVSEQCGV